MRQGRDQVFRSDDPADTPAREAPILLVRRQFGHSLENSIKADLGKSINDDNGILETHVQVVLSECADIDMR